MSDAVNPYLDGHMTRCTLASPISSQDTSAAIIYFTFDLKQKRSVAATAGTRAIIN